MALKTILPAHNSDFRSAIYNGDIFILSGQANSLQLVNDLKSLVGQHFPKATDLQMLHEYYNAQQIWDNLCAARKDIANVQFSRTKVSPIISPLFNDNALFDVLRLRCNPHNGHTNPAAANSYTAHRDTWYANPQNQINIWIPFFDVEENQGFTFFPSFWNKATENDSHEFNYKEWTETTGFQAAENINNAKYPSVSGLIQDPQEIKLQCKAGDMVIFAAHHLHQSCQNTSGRTRLSVDFRIVDICDSKAQKGAPNVDNKSTGNASIDYLELKQTN